MKSMAIVACAAVGLWSCTAVAGDENGRRARAVQSPSLKEMTQVVEAQEHLTSAAYDLIGWLASDGTQFDTSGSPDDNLTEQGRGKKPKPAQMAMAMLGTAAMSTMMMKSIGAIMMFMMHSFFVTKLGLILAAYLLACKLSEMKSPPPKKVIKWSPPPPSSSSYDEQPPQMIMAGGPYPDSQQSSYADPLQQDLFQQQPPPQQQQPSSQYGAPAPQQQYGAPAPQQQYGAPADFGGGGGGGGDFMQAHYSNVSPVTYRPPINKLAAVDNAAKSAKAGRL